MLSQATLVYFSPTGGVKQAALQMAKALAQQVDLVDLSLPEQPSHPFGPEQPVLFALPVFGGRLPDLAAARLQTCRGQQTPAVAVVVYGNRAYEDALLELSDCLQRQGFAIVAGAALVAEHSIVHQLAAGRPDAQDARQLAEFAQQLEKRLQQPPTVTVSLPGNRPYKEWQKAPVTPVASDACVECGLCAEQCPNQAIPLAHPKQTELARCIMCMRCVALCPQQARALPLSVQEQTAEKLAPWRQVRRENELFL